MYYDAQQYFYDMSDEGVVGEADWC